MSNIDLSLLKTALIQTFPNYEVPHDIGFLKIGDIDDWDSLGNFNLLLAVEDLYGVRFSVEQMSTIKAIDQIITALID